MNFIFTFLQIMDPDGFLLDPCQFSSEVNAYRKLIAHTLEENLAYQQFWVNLTIIDDGSGCPRKVYSLFKFILFIILLTMFLQYNNYNNDNYYNYYNNCSICWQKEKIEETGETEETGD